MDQAQLKAFLQTNCPWAQMSADEFLLSLEDLVQLINAAVSEPNVAILTRDSQTTTDRILVKLSLVPEAFAY